MKCSLINLIVFVIIVNSDANKPLFRPQLPIGEYRIKFLAVFRCESSNDQLQFNLYLSKTSVNTTEIKGNLTYLEPIDDSLNNEVNLAIKDTVNGWKDNAHVYKTAKACSSLKMLMGNSWTAIMESLGMNNISCPIPVGCYKSSGIRLNKNFYANLPKQFFYGTYKSRIQFTKNKVVHGCTISIIEVKRPWETD
ncbi:uncharacterized protein LOC132952651 [Metopolophium dirhodum]|uniref:uncharacterized protein LOC132952651 n=1 Tax=Metopolophium dirhodum TaxID=44670 RepID=UPI00299067E9|nr:uncharacterized protein LOC132952651 [Metopolophium dirhodum]